MMKRRSSNTSRENRLEELGRVDAERARTARGKKNLAAEKRRVVKELDKPMRSAVKAAKMPLRKTK